MEEVRFKNTRGLELAGYLYRGKGRKAVILCHALQVTRMRGEVC
jgi:hypothetical protein